MTLVEYFVRHYTLVIDNDQSTYRAATYAARQVVRDSDITRTEWLALSTQEREERFADDIGDAILSLIENWCDEALVDRDNRGALIMREVMIFGDSDIGYGLGQHFMPKDADIADLLDDEDSDDE